MTDFHAPRNDFSPSGEPRRDARLGALLRDLLGDVPMGEVKWNSLAGRVGATIRAGQATSWWSHVERWQRRAIPLALAAGLLGAVVLVHSWIAHPEAARLTSATDLVSAVVAGAPAADAATTFTHGVTTVADLTADTLE